MTRAIRFERGNPADDETAGHEELRHRFQERTEQGSYDALFDRSVRSVLREGAAIRTIDEELGAIRFSLAKLLAEEQDASKLAAGVARLTGAAVQAIRLAQVLSKGEDEPFADLLDQLLAEYGEPVESS